MAHMLAHLGPPTESMWRDLGRVTLDAATVQDVSQAVAAEVASLPMAAVVQRRDEVLVGLLQAKAAAGLP
jgi:hypothetical protein